MKRFTLINKYKHILNDVINNLNLNKKDKRGRHNKFENYFLLKKVIFSFYNLIDSLCILIPYILRYHIWLYYKNIPKVFINFKKFMDGTVFVPPEDILPKRDGRPQGSLNATTMQISYELFILHCFLGVCMCFCYFILQILVDHR